MISKLANKLIRFQRKQRRYPKIFCIGRNKTGTTSLERAFVDLGFTVGDLRQAELLLPYYIRKDFVPIIEFCKTAQVFQDSPFSYPDTYRHLDNAYPKSLFILSVRDSPEQWYNSITTAHAKTIGNGSIPTASDLKKADYVREGWAWEVNRALYNTPENDPYNKKILIDHYNRHNAEVIEYFKGRNDLLVINVSDSGAYNRFCDFIGVRPIYEEFPWENKTAAIAT